MKPASSAQLRITDSGKGKGKAHPSPEPYIEDVTMGAPFKFDVAAAYEWHALYDNNDWSDNNVVRANAGDILKVPTSEFGRTVHGILQGLHINSEGASRSALVEGRVSALQVTNCKGTPLFYFLFSISRIPGPDSTNADRWIPMDLVYGSALFETISHRNLYTR